MAFRDKSAKLRALAASLGVTIKRAPLRDSWFLFDEDGEPLRSERDTTAFLTERAVTLLKKRRKALGAADA